MNGVLQWIKRDDRHDVYSFDVFDTLLRRRVDPPEEIKRLVAQHISERLAATGIHRDTDAILAERSRVEDRLREAATSRGLDALATLDEITAGTLESIGAGGVLTREEIVTYELALEKAATEPMPGVRDVLTYLRSRQKRIVAVSETYLSSSQMSSLLEHHALLPYVDRLYVSCDLGRSKLTGNLFRHVVENEGRRVVHIGDHYTFDYQIPKRLKMKALWFNSWDERRRREGLRKLSAGENKLAYVNAIIGSPDRREGELFRIGHDVFGPALTVFVHCVAERAKKDNIERVFFVARDGFLLKKIYQILQNSLYADTSLPAAKYLCLSRLAVRRASVSVDGLTEADVAEAFRYIALRGKNVRLVDILRSYALEADSFSSLIGRYGLDAHLPIVDPADDRIRQLLRDDQFRETVTTRGRTDRELLRQYLAGIGFMGSKRVALVDANSEGLTQSLLSQVFAGDSDYPDTHGYYFCLLSLGVDNPRISRDLSTAAGVISDWRSDAEISQHAFRHFGMFVELFSHPNHGVTTGYRKVNGGTVPVFRRTSQESQYHLTCQVLEGILAYARKYAVCYRLHNCQPEQLLRDVRSDARQWLHFPPREHTEALKVLFVISDWPMESRQYLPMKVRSRISPAKTVKGLFHRRSL
jgi:FMN phosphatase YigB (HAD superfamily)